MEAYGDFAYVYDTFMDQTPYEKWCDYIEAVLTEYGVPHELLLDLGCGTGVLTRMLSERGYNMIGIDNSWEMLSIAREAEYQDSFEDDEPEDCMDDEEQNLATDCSEFISDGENMDDETNEGILYLLQDMREFELYGTVGAVVSVCDSVNYLLTDEDVIKTFSLVNNYLDPGGIFLFDFNTLHKYRDVIGDTTIAENRETCSFIWENYFNCDTAINEYMLTVYNLDEESGLYDRFSENHLQRGYGLDEMTAFVKKSGLEFLKAVDADTHGSVNEDSERIYIIARECTKEI